MAEQKIQEFPANPSTLFGAAMPFQFEVKWRSVTATFKPVPREISNAVKPEPEPHPISAVLRQFPGGGEGREFETVLQREMPTSAPEASEASYAYPHFERP